MTRRRATWATTASARFVVGCIALVGLAACGSAATGSQADTNTASNAETTVTVFAAASLAESFRALGEAFTTANPQTDIRFNFAGTSELATQIEQGAGADVFASADNDHMSRLVNSGAVGAPIVFATNTLEIIVAADNPQHIAGVDDLADPNLVLVLCAPDVPCGRYARQMLDRAAVVAAPKSLETNVGSVVTKVVSGEADAGIVYATDVIAVGDRALGVPIPDDINVTAQYPIAPVGTASAASQRFIDFVTSTDGQGVLARFGFGAP